MPPDTQPPGSLPEPAGPIVPLIPTPEFVASALEIGVELEPSDLERLGRFLAMLLRANETMNLTAIKEPSEAWRKHALDALTLVPVLASFEKPEGEEGAVSVVDIGSGGGVPALPLAIVLPDMKFTLVEATGKKVEFLNRTIRELKLRHARVVAERAENVGQDHKGHREQYDIATARALGHLAVVIELAGPLIKPHGLLVAVKGAKAEQELEESGKALGLVGLKHVQTIETPTGKLVVMQKTTRTPRLYPRRDGEPARVPLGVGKRDG